MNILTDIVLRFAEYAALAVGFALIFNTTAIFHFAYGSLYSVAAYGLAVLMIEAQFPLFWAGLGGIALATLVSALVYLLAYQPMLRRYGPAAGHSLFIISLGLFIVLGAVMKLPYGSRTQQLPKRMSGSPVHDLLGTMSWGELISFGVTIGCLASVLLVLGKTGFGLRLRAVGADSSLAESIGVNVARMRFVSMALGTALSAVVAVTQAATLGIVTPYLGLPAVVAAAIAVFLGGIGSVKGAVFGAFVLAIVQTMAASLVGRWSDSLVYTFLLLLILFRPRGLLNWGDKSVRKAMGGSP